VDILLALGALYSCPFEGSHVQTSVKRLGCSDLFRIACICSEQLRKPRRSIFLPAKKAEAASKVAELFFSSFDVVLVAQS